jgi:tRNA pseudouridine55 synthase
MSNSGAGERGAGPAGVLLVDKPSGVTSHDVVARVRHERGVKGGHAGTLDPFATGLLLVLLGKATRLQRYLLGFPKTYRATARLGWRSTTGDPDGELTRTGSRPERLELPTGRIEQRVPMTAAVRVEGERLYRRAHRGEEVETPVREVEVHRAELLSADAERATYEIECSTGTYVRSLIETLGDAYCERLRRTAVGPFRVDDAGLELGLAEALAFMPERRLSEGEARSVGFGQRLAAADEPEGPVRLTFEGELVAVAARKGDTLAPEVVLA